MKRATIKNLNEYIRKTYPELDIELWKCGGIFPFSGPSHGEDDLYIESIYVNALSQAPYQRWCEMIDWQIKDAKAEQKRLKGEY